MRTMTTTTLFNVVVFVVLCTVVTVAVDRPNFVVVITDDQDVLLDGLKPVPKTRYILGSFGTSFANAFTTTPLCCPSRSSLLTGRYSHNTGVVNNTIQGGCGDAKWQQGLEKKSLAVELKALNYTTFFAGKYLNQYGKKEAGGVAHVPDGWDHWTGLVGNSKYYNYSLSVNGTEVKHGDDYESDYLTDVLKKSALDFLEGRFGPRRKGPSPSKTSNASSPFLMMVSVPAPHSPFTPAPKYAKDFPQVDPHRLPSFGKFAKDKHWLLRQAKSPLSNASLAYIDDAFKNRWRSLESVDDLVQEVLESLWFYGLLNNTFVLFTSDNGFHLGQFCLPNDKRQMYEFDVRVPFIVRGPGVKSNVTSKQIALNIDIAPTIIDLAGGVVPKDMDGISLKPALMRRGSSSGRSGSGSGDAGESENEKFPRVPPRDSFTIEYTGEAGIGIPEACHVKKDAGVGHCFPDCVCEDSVNNTYVCVRTLNEVKDDVYCKFLDHQSFEEQYDLKTDPYQLENKASSLGEREKSIYRHKLKFGHSCSGQLCRLMNDDLMDNLFS